MGLTVHYSLRFSGTIEEARPIIEGLRQKALDMPFKEVSEIIERKYTPESPMLLRDPNENEEDSWFLIQSGMYFDYSKVERYDSRYHKKGDRVKYSRSIAPTHVIGFRTWPGDGCEEMNIGLAIFPEEICIDEHDYTKFTRQQCRDQGLRFPHWRKGKWRKTRLGGKLQWSSFCKTQYAGEPDCGGVKNFTKCHLTVIKMLDHCKQAGILHSVSDEGGFWKTRDLNVLVRGLDDYTLLVKGMNEMLKTVGVDGVTQTPSTPDDLELFKSTLKNPKVFDEFLAMVTKTTV